MRNIFKISLVSFYSLILLEVGSFITLKSGLVKDYLKSVGRNSVNSLVHQGHTWRNEQEPWGGWHIPNSISRDVKSCYDVTYKANSVGARGDEFYQNYIGKRVIILGDSFAEGIGVDYKDTVAGIIDDDELYSALNFGSANNFGPVQYFLVYENLASKYNHSDLVIMFFPLNDFIDNSLTAKKFANSNRYRPYYKIDENGKYEIFYKKNARKTFEYPKKSYLKAVIKNTNIYRLYLSTKIYLKNSKKKERIKESKTNHWFNSKKEDQEASIFYLKKIINSAENLKNIVIFLIPSKSDIEYAYENNLNSEDVFWFNELSKLAKKDSRLNLVNGFNYLPRKKNSINQLFLQCDGHWSKEGNLWAAEIIKNFLK